MKSRIACMVILLVSVPVLLLCAALLLLPDANQPCGLIDAIQGRPSGCIANFDPAVGEEFDSFSFLPDGQTLALIGTTLRSGAESHGRLVMIDLANRRIVRSSRLPGAGYRTVFGPSPPGPRVRFC
jgi:hypothetical protein